MYRILLLHFAILELDSAVRLLLFARSYAGEINQWRGESELVSLLLLVVVRWSWPLEEDGAGEAL